MKTMAFIPARGGSKRVPGKNLKPLGGRSLLQRAVESARESEVFENIIVSSDDPEVKAAVSNWDSVTYHPRDPKLANDLARVPEVVHAYLSEMQETERPDVVGVILPPCPFRTKDHVREAFDRFKQENPQGFLVSITKYDFPPQFALSWCDETEHRKNNQLKLEHPEVYATTTRSQSVKPQWHPNGAMYFSYVPAFLKTRSFFSDPLIGYEMSPEDSFDIDWPHQWAMAEALIASKS